MSVISPTGKTRPGTGSGRMIIKLTAILFLPLMVLAVAACDNNPGPTPTPTFTISVPIATPTATATATNSQAPNDGAPKGTTLLNTSNGQGAQNALEANAGSGFPRIALAAQGQAQDIQLAIATESRPAVAKTCEYTSKGAGAPTP